MGYSGYWRYVRKDGIIVEFALSKEELLPSQKIDIQEMMRKIPGTTWEDEEKLLSIDYMDPSDMDEEAIEDDLLLLDTPANGYCIGNNPEYVEKTIRNLLTTTNGEIDDE